jgi:hypothetical protein
MQLPLKTEGGRKEAQTTQKLNFIKRFFLRGWRCDFGVGEAEALTNASGPAQSARLLPARVVEW